MTIIELIEWCRKYDRENKYQQNSVNRFLIAQYQVTQGLQWGGADSSWESYAAGIIHYMILAEREGCHIEKNANFWDTDYNPLNIHLRVYVLCLGDISQQLIYKMYSTTTKRKNRDMRSVCTQFNVPTVPELFQGVYSEDPTIEHNVPTINLEGITKLAYGPTLLMDKDPHFREGCVIEVQQSDDEYVHHKIFKYVSDDYLTRKGGMENH